jgi:peptidyl-prolyl cis-trans isomerase C
MKLNLLAAAVLAATLLPLAVSAQNITLVNGKPVPKSRVDTLLQQATRAGQQLPPGADKQARDQVVLREIFVQEAERRGIAARPDFRAQMELEAKGEYDKFKAQASGVEYRARHILVEKEDEAKALIAQIKAGGSFEELAKKNSKDPGSGANGGDLDFAKADSYVPEFGQALARLKKGEMTDAPVKSQFGFHIIRLDDTREASFPAFDDVKAQIKQRLEQTKIQRYQEELRAKAKTDYKFTE